MFGEGEAPDWRRYSFDWQAGTPAVFMLAADVSIERVIRAIAGFRSAASEFRARKTDLLVLTPPDRAQTHRMQHPGETDIQIIDCPAAFFSDNAVPMNDVTVVVVDRNIRVALRRSVGAIGQTVAQCLECLGQMVPEVPAPILILPNVLSRDMCRTLIDRFESGDVIEGKVAGVDAAGRPFCHLDYSIKSRKDLQIRRDDPFHPKLRGMLIDRCAKEIAKAFQIEVAYTDRLMIARYDAPHGWFRRHRDNSSRNVAFRQFAITVNLNTGEYDGGCLTFPEFNDQPYGALSGAGIIFSTSLLHEVTHVTRGRRYALLTFFYDEASEAKRQAYEQESTVRGT